MSLAARTGHARTRPGPKEPALRHARVCYDHLAGDLGVRMLDSLVATGRLDADLQPTAYGEAFFTALGIDLPALRGARRPLGKACLDWSVRRSHLAGSLGAEVLGRLYALGWAKRVEGERVVAFTASGEKKFAEVFGLSSIVIPAEA